MTLTANDISHATGVSGANEFSDAEDHTNFKDSSGTKEVNGIEALNDMNGIKGIRHNRSKPNPHPYVQQPVAVISMACRLSDECLNPQALWKFLEKGKIAINTPPGTRFSLNTHYDGSLKAQTMASPGGMFLQSVDPRDLDAQFFRLSGIEASSMDPQQRQLLEVVYEGL